MSSGVIVLVLLLALCCGLTLSGSNKPPLLDPAKARQLFRQVDRAGNNDGNLTMSELQNLMKTFDLNDNNLVEQAEFIQVWQFQGFGNEESARYLFQRADTDGDGTISVNSDLGRVFQYLDMNHDGKISEPEFVIMWATLSS